MEIYCVSLNMDNPCNNITIIACFYMTIIIYIPSNHESTQYNYGN